MAGPCRNEQRDGHLLIGGTGRAGTSFLVRYLTELGLDTHLSRHGEEGFWDEEAHAGLETIPLPETGSDLPYVVKYPWLYQCIDHILKNNAFRLDAVIVPVRDLNDAAASRVLVELQAMHRRAPWMAEAEQTWEVWGSTTGGVTYSLNPLDQGRLLAVGFHHLIERLIQADVPIILLAFPRLVEDPSYLFRKMQPVLPPTISETCALAAHQRISDLNKIRVKAEMEAAGGSHRPAAGPLTGYAPHDRLDAAAAKREITRLRIALADANAAAEAAAEHAGKELSAARLAATRAEEQAAAARLAATRTEEQAAAANATAARAGLAMQAEVERLQHDLATVFASRSWRLTHPYRAIGGFLQRLRAKGDNCGAGQKVSYAPPTFEAVAVPPIQQRCARTNDPERQTLDWLDDNTFKTDHFIFKTSIDRFDGRTADRTVALLKNRDFVELYHGLLKELRPQRILEIGFFQGGMPLLIAELLAPEKIVGIDYLQPSDALLAMINQADLQDTIKLYGSTLQSDLPKLRRILEIEFGNRPIDLIIDDASHEYENSRGCFQELFGYLRPGGKYVIEDWGWLHWPGDEWQTSKSPFWGQTAMTNLIFEIVMTLGTQHPKIIGRLEILSWACAVVTRGDGLEHGERVDLANSRLTSGREFHPL